MLWSELKQQLKKQAEVQPSLNGSLIKLWGTSKQLTDLADCCYKEGQLEHAYVYYLRAANTLIMYAPKHKDFASANLSNKNDYRSLAARNLEMLEKLEVVLEEKWNAPTPELEPASDDFESEQSLPHQPEGHHAESKDVPPYPLPSAPPIDDDTFGVPPPHSSNQAQNALPSYTLPASIQESNSSAPVAITPDTVPQAFDNFANLRISDSSRRKEFPGTTSQRQASILESISATKKLSIPSDLPWGFLRRAERNTSNNIETCGFLLGTLSPANDKFIVTQLYIPPQSGTSDTVNVGAEGDEATLNYAISNNLCILGWIHTHPSQECFLSSVDLHTQFIYQATQSSFVGIVLAPSFPNNNIGYFSVTEKGLSILRNCSQDGFHRHSESEGLYGVSKHVILDDSRTTQVIDSR